MHHTSSHYKKGHLHNAIISRDTLTARSTSAQGTSRAFQTVSAANDLEATPWKQRLQWNPPEDDHQLSKLGQTQTSKNLKKHELSPVPRQSSQSLESKRPKDQQSTRIKTIPGPPHSFVASSGQSTLDLRTSKSQVVVLVGPILEKVAAVFAIPFQRDSFWTHTYQMTHHSLPAKWPTCPAAQDSPSGHGWQPTVLEELHMKVPIIAEHIALEKTNCPRSTSPSSRNRSVDPKENVFRVGFCNNP